MWGEGIDRSAILRQLHEASANPFCASGPCAVFKTYLAQIQWVIHCHDGDLLIEDTKSCTFSLLNVSESFVRQRLDEAWDDIVAEKIRKRKEFVHWPTPCLVLNSEGLDELCERDRAIMTHRLTAGVILQHHRRKWANGSPDPCPMCGEPEDRVHLTHNCTGTSDIRDANADLIHQVCSWAPWMVGLPLAYKHPDHEALVLANCQATFPPPFPAQIDSHGEVRIFYTDGSSLNPTAPFGAIASWAIVEDLANHDSDRISHWRRYTENWVLPDSFHCVQTSTVTGRQTVARAEFSALIQVVRSCDAAIICTDSKYAMDLFNQVAGCSQAKKYIKCENFDLIIMLCDLFSSKRAADFVTLKVKAHLEDEQITSPLQGYAVLGNRHADYAAKKAASPEASAFAARAFEVCAFYKKQTRLKKDFFELAVQLDKVRLDALDKKRIAEKLESKNRCTATALKAWQPQECAPLPPIQLTDDQLASFQSGASLTVVLCEWAAMLWPNIKHPDDPGIALVELVYNFLLVTQTALPRIVARSAYRVTYEYPTDQGPLALLPGALEDACRLFDALDKQLKKFYGKDLFPLHLRGKMPFLRYFGCSQKRVGYYTRPLMLRSLETISGIAEGLRKGTINSLHVPNMPPLIQKRHHPNDDLSPDEVYATFRRHQQRAYAR